MNDPASFDRSAIALIWGEYYGCAITHSNKHVELHHILGRGGRRARKLFSSPLNAIPLDHDIHASGYRDHPLMSALFLSIALKEVNDAIRRGDYAMTDNDKEFLQYSSQYRI